MNLKLSAVSTFVCAVCLSLTVGATTGLVNPQKSTARFINIETPFRCSVQNFGDLDVATTIALKPTDFKLTFFDQMDSLPRYEVNGLSFDKKPIDRALQELVEEAGIDVYTEDGYYPSMSADDVYGELGQVVDELTQAGDVFYRYDATKKELYLSRKGRFELQLPENRMVVLALLDALRGAGLYNISPNWKENTILMTLTQSEKETVDTLLQYILQDGYLLLADTKIFTVKPKAKDVNWQSIIRNYGPEKVVSAKNGLLGKILTVDNQYNHQQFMERVNRDFIISELSQGVAIVPNNWKMRFNVGQCSYNKEMATFSVLLSAYIKSPQRVETDVTFDSKVGEISSFNTVSAIDDELIILGIPVEQQNLELMATLKLRLIRLVKEK